MQRSCYSDSWKAFENDSGKNRSLFDDLCPKTVGSGFTTKYCVTSLPLSGAKVHFNYFSARMLQKVKNYGKCRKMTSITWQISLGGKTLLHKVIFSEEKNAFDFFGQLLATKILCLLTPGNTFEKIPWGVFSIFFTFGHSMAYQNSDKYQLTSGNAGYK